MNGLHADNSYLIERLTHLGLSQQGIEFYLPNGEHTQLYSADEEGNINIHFHRPDGSLYYWRKPNTKFPRPFIRKRLKNPNGDQKYFQEKGSPQVPFFPPKIIKKFQDGTPINTLVLVEGEFKAHRGEIAGLDIVGIPSIHGFYDGSEQRCLHPDIVELISKLGVRNIVFLTDADTLSVRWEEEKDLRKRQASFYSAIKNFRYSLESLVAKDLLKVVIFSHIQTKYLVEGKGLDDLLSYYTAINDKIVFDLLKLQESSIYFRSFIINDINSDLNKVYHYLGLTNPEHFYLTYKDFIGEKSFLYSKSKYEWNANDQRLIEQKPQDQYIRVGIRYYKVLENPLSSGETVKNYKPWTKGCIIQDHGKDFVNLIETYNDWCCRPCHIDFLPVINGFYNRYNPLKYLPKPGLCDTILRFLNHIFGEQIELGLDYFQLLYLKPTQMLPVLCLVSTDRNTGKTTLLNLMVAIFGSNATIIRNEDFESQFNSDWADKLLILVDETFIEKKKIYERIKSVSTGQMMKVEAKGQDKVDMEFFGKIILCSNNENNFIPIDNPEIRFWVRKINPFGIENPNLISEMKKEIPAFLHMLSERKLSTAKKTRMWFAPEEIYTEALGRIKHYNKSFTEKELLQILSDWMIEFETSELKYTLSDLQDILKRSGIYTQRFKLREMLIQLGLESVNSSYTKRTFFDGIRLENPVSSGRHYTFNKEGLERMLNIRNLGVNSPLG